MAVKLIIAPETERDIANAYAWYEDQRIGLGEEFLSCVEACIELIRRTPEINAFIYENYRRGLVRRFPYTIFYEYAGDAITIYSVFHSSRDPRKWLQRLP